uniref:Insulin-like growth factor-binding protein 3 n=1 Tax=Denticeps clupeoides TaxID=299321 RepID=A0AAY4DY95_9TELE
MATGARALLLAAAALASAARLAAPLGPAVRCAPCDAAARALCEPVRAGCAETVREPGCGCCATCALPLGHACGIYTGRCGSGASCRRRPGEARPLRALLEGRGVCASLASVSNQLPAGTSVMFNNSKSQRYPVEGAKVNPTTHEVHASSSEAFSGSPHAPTQHHPLYQGHPKAEVIRRDRVKKTESFKVERIPHLPGTDQKNFSLEMKLDPEYGPCRREMESILKALKVRDTINPHGFPIPNCDRKGFYKKKQCQPSKGRKRGFCWCVDKYGHPLPGYKGEARCMAAAQRSNRGKTTQE